MALILLMTIFSLLNSGDTLLKRIPSIVSPELLQALASMGHNDRLVLGDANFPAASTAGSHTLVRADGHKMTDLLRAITTLLPVEGSVYLMDVIPEQKTSGFVQGGVRMKSPRVWRQYQAILDKAEKRSVKMERVEQQQFYAMARDSQVVVATGEPAYYGNIILKAGVIDRMPPLKKSSGKYRG